jgi:3',5'-cyclic AMP phosphodiesterase CpdA
MRSLVAPVRAHHLVVAVGTVLLTAVIAVAFWPAPQSPAEGPPLSTPLSRLPAGEREPLSGQPVDPSDPVTSAGSPESTDGSGADDGEGSSEASVAPAAEAGGNGYTIAAAGDIACDPSNDSFNHGRGTRNSCRQQDVADLVERLDPDLVLALGDLQYDDATLAKFRRVYDKSWGDFKNRTWAVPGNHEYYVRNAQGFFDYFGSRLVGRDRGFSSRDVDAAGWHIVGLNSNCELDIDCDPGSAQYQWLEEDLRTSPSQCTLAFMHHPRFSSGPHGNDRSVAPLMELMYQYGVEVVLVGHEHIYERFAPIKPNGDRNANTGIRQITVGTGGGQHYWIEDRQPNSVVHNTDRFGVLEMGLFPGGYSWRFAGIGGSNFTDSGRDTCH